MVVRCELSKAHILIFGMNKGGFNQTEAFSTHETVQSNEKGVNYDEKTENRTSQCRHDHK